MNEATYILIDRYINKQMNADELQEFETRLANDKELLDEYKSTIAANEVVNEAGRLELKSTLEAFETQKKSLKDERKIIPLWIKRGLSLAALLIATIAIYQFGFLSKSLSTSEVFESNFEVYSAPSNLRDFSDTRQLSWEDAMTAYEAKNFDESLAKLDTLVSDIPRYLASFYAGISAMAKSDPDYKMAIKHFDRVLTIDNDYAQQALWYKGLSLLILNRKDEANEIFESIVTSKSYNYKKAEKILKVKYLD